MDIFIDIKRPVSRTYYYEGHIREEDKTYCFEIRDDGYDPEVNWLDEYKGSNMNIDNEILEKYSKLWKR